MPAETNGCELIYTTPADIAGASWLRYGSIVLRDVLTEDYTMEQIRTEDGSQMLYEHHVIKVIGVVKSGDQEVAVPGINNYGQYVSDNVQLNQRGTAPYDYTRNATDNSWNIVLLKNWLLHDRQNLTWAINGSIVLESPLYNRQNVPNRFSCDSNQGPKPLYCQVTKIAGTGMFYVRFGIETWIDPCSNNAVPRVIQSHRYSMTHDVDGDTWLTTRTVRGLIKFRADILEYRGTPPSSYESLWAHPIPKGYQRKNVRIEALPNGMEMAYSFTDQEIVLPLGTLSSATKLTAEFMLGSSYGGKDNKTVQTQVACHVAAIGPKNEFRFNLLRMAIKIALQKLQKANNLIMIHEVNLVYSLDNRHVDLTVKALWKPVGMGPGGIQMNMTGLLTDDEEDLDTALAEYRAAGESRQGTQSHMARHPALRNFGTKGTSYLLAVGSALQYGCFAQTQPSNVFIKADEAGKLYVASDDEIGTAEETGVRSITGGAVGYTFQQVTQFTIDTSDTGLSTTSLNANGWYEEWQMDTRYYTNHQRAILPIGATQAMSPGDILTFVPPQVATLGFPYTLKCVHWSVAWVGDFPNNIILPGPDDDTNDTLIAEDITPAVPAICNSTNRAWRISGTYWFLTDKLVTASATEKAYFDYIDGGIPIGSGITDPYYNTANNVPQARFTAGYTPKFT